MEVVSSLVANSSAEPPGSHWGAARHWAMGHGLCRFELQFHGNPIKLPASGSPRYCVVARGIFFFSSHVPPGLGISQVASGTMGGTEISADRYLWEPLGTAVTEGPGRKPHALKLGQPRKLCSGMGTFRS